MILPTSLVSTARNNQSLRTSVLHIGAVACQQFALQLLGWFQEFLVRHYLFRKTFSELVQRKQETFCIRHILEYDVKLWKTARTCWHRLLISGMLMEYDNKMILAQEFSRRYATIVEDFISDDHDHAFSIVSLSVQLFTVPSIAHHLIAHEGIFDKLLHTFYHVAIEKFIRNKTLHFSKNIASLTFFKRANYILYDLRYLLSLKPDVLSNDLRNGFLEGRHRQHIEFASHLSSFTPFVTHRLPGFDARSKRDAGHGVDDQTDWPTYGLRARVGVRLQPAHQAGHDHLAGD